MRYPVITALFMLVALPLCAEDYSVTPSISIGGITELGNSFDPYYKFVIDTVRPQTLGPMSLNMMASVSTYQIPYYLTPGGQNSTNKIKQLVDEWKVDYAASASYPFLYDEVLYQLHSGVGGIYIYNDIVSFNAAGPSIGFSATTDNDWGKALLGLDSTYYLTTESSYSGKSFGTNYSSNTQNKSIFGKPVFAVDYKISLATPYNTSILLDYAFDGQMIKFDSSYRYYNGISVGVRF